MAVMSSMCRTSASGAQAARQSRYRSSTMYGGVAASHHHLTRWRHHISSTIVANHSLISTPLIHKHRHDLYCRPQPRRPHLATPNSSPNLAISTTTDMSSPSRRLLCLDFDGVLCDSAGESAVAALKCITSPEFNKNISRQAQGALEQVENEWLLLQQGVGLGGLGELEVAVKDEESIRKWLIRNVKDARPAVTTGYENVLMMMMLLKGLQQRIRHVMNSSDDSQAGDQFLPANGIELMKQWGVEGSGGLCDVALIGAGDGNQINSEDGLISSYNNGLSRAELVTLFGTTRDEMIHDDQQGWIDANSLYDGIGDALRHLFNLETEKTDVWIVTTKQERFARLLLSSLADIEVPRGKCVSVTSSGRPKSELLYEISHGIVPMEVEDSLHESQTSSSTVYDEKIFVEDRLGALERVIVDSRLDDWRLVLVDYGYNTEDERTQAKEQTDGRIQLVNQRDMCRLLRGEEN